MVVDLLGWFTGPSAAQSATGLFVPIGPRRLLDTREQPTAGVAGRHRRAAGRVRRRRLARHQRHRHARRPSRLRHRLSGRHAAARHVDAQPGACSNTRSPTWRSPASAIAGSPTTRTPGSTSSSTSPACSPEHRSPPANRRHPNSPGSSRVLMVGDSTLAAAHAATPTRSAALVGFEAIVDAKPRAGGWCARRASAPSPT